jgi:ketosteroid isomerase-like protein
VAPTADEVVARIRDSNDAWHRRDLDGVLAAYADDVVWDTRDAFPDGREYRGKPAFRAYCEEVLERWSRDEHRLEIKEIFAVEGASRFLVDYRMLGRSRAGLPVDAPWVHVFDFRAGLIVRGRNFTALDSALEALGSPQLGRIWPAGEAA